MHCAVEGQNCISFNTIYFGQNLLIFYPILANFLEMDYISAVIFFGATIHDVAQVIGAGFTLSNETGDTATIIKLFRVTLLFPVVILISLLSYYL